MNTITYSQALAEVRTVARNAGLTFKKQNAYINGTQAYMFTDRVSGRKVAENFTLWSAYDNAMSGYISSYNKKTGMFED